MIFLTYDDSRHTDGFGAQLHRILELYAIALDMGIGFQRPKFSELMIHRLDEVDSENYLEYLKIANDFIPTPNILEINDTHLSLRVKKIKRWKINLLTALSSLLGLDVLVKVVYPHSFFGPEDDKLAGIRNLELSFCQDSKKYDLVVHVRFAGPQLGFLVGKEKVTRQLFANDYVSAIYRILEKKKITSIGLVTDFTTNGEYFYPMSNQLDFWRESGYRVINESIWFDGSHMIEEILDHFPEATVMRGGNPLENFCVMANASNLLISNSSYSYSAALLNDKGQIYFFSNYWQRFPSDWISVVP